jgi:hypothetical protein
MGLIIAAVGIYAALVSLLPGLLVLGLAFTVSRLCGTTGVLGKA